MLRLRDDAETSTAERPTILVVEDEILVRWLVVEIFEEAGYEVVEASTGDEALSIFADRQDIRAVFSDIHMPGDRDGIALAWGVRSTRPDCPIVLASGRGLPQTAELPDGTRYLPKPYRAETALAVVEELLA
jgi:CheY-like chemotaxis protein